MPEHSTTTALGTPPTSPTRFWLIGGLLSALVVAIVMAGLVLAPDPQPDAEAFGGTDAAVTELLEEQGVEPWFQPIFEPGSGEVESGLFAVQAALGAGVLGYCLGSLRRRGTSPAAMATPKTTAPPAE